MLNLVKISYEIFGSHAMLIERYFSDVRNDLYRANLNFTLEEYISVALFTAVITFFMETVMLAFIFGLLQISAAVAVFLSLTLSSAISGTLFFLFYSYPAAAAASREKNINKILPFSVSYLAAIASGHLAPITLFKTLSMFEEYGEIAIEAKNIVKDVEMFGMTFASAIKKHARRTPSKAFGELLWGMNSVMTSGGDVVTYLRQKSEELMEDHRRKIRKYSQDLSLFVEIYLTLIITGSIFFIVLSSIISTMTGGVEAVIVQTFVVFVLLPLISVGFIIIIKSISPVE